MPTPPRILVCGAANVDLVVPVEHLPQRGETLVGKSIAQVPGGKGANQAVAARRLGAEVAFLGRVGRDDWGAFVRGQLQREGLDLACLVDDADRSTGVAMIFVGPTGENMIVAVPAANLGVTPVDVAAALRRNPHLDAIQLTLEAPLPTVQALIAAGNERGIPVILDAAPPATYALSELRGVTVISPNETEAESLTGVHVETLEDAARAAAILREGTRARHVVMKLASRGALVCDAGAPQGTWIEPFKVTAIDTTAAGDAFTAAMTVRLCQGDALRDAVRNANAAGALATTKMGAQPSLPTAEEVDRLLAASMGVQRESHTNREW